MRNDSFVLFTKIKGVVDELSLEQKGELFQAILDYEATGEIPDVDGVVKIAFIPIKQDLDDNHKKWEKTKKARSDAGKKAAEAKKANSIKTEQTTTNLNKHQQTLTNVNKVKQTDTKHTDNVDVYVDVNDNVSSKEDVDIIVNEYNRICVSLPKCAKVTDGRKKHVKARLKDFGRDAIKQAFIKAEASDFLSGRSARSSDHSNWKCNFDWIVGSAEHMAKILEGQYDNRGKPNSPYADAWMNLEEEINAGDDNDKGVGS